MKTVDVGQIWYADNAFWLIDDINYNNMRATIINIDTFYKIEMYLNVDFTPFFHSSWKFIKK